MCIRDSSRRILRRLRKKWQYYLKCDAKRRKIPQKRKGENTNKGKNRNKERTENEYNE